MDVTEQGENLARAGRHGHVVGTPRGDAHRRLGALRRNQLSVCSPIASRPTGSLPGSVARLGVQVAHPQAVKSPSRERSGCTRRIVGSSAIPSAVDGLSPTKSTKSCGLSTQARIRLVRYRPQREMTAKRSRSSPARGDTSGTNSVDCPLMRPPLRGTVDPGRPRWPPGIRGLLGRQHAVQLLEDHQYTYEL